MANGFPNAFAPINRATQKFQNVLANVPVMRGQRLQNQVRQMQIQNAMQQQGAQQYVQQQQQMHPFMQQQQQQDLTMAPKSMQKWQNALSQLPKQGERFRPNKAELDYWKQTDLTKYRELMGEQIDTGLKLFEVDPDAGERFFNQQLGMDVKSKKDGKEIEVRTEDGVIFGGPLESVRDFKEFTRNNPNPTPEVLEQAAVNVGLTKFQAPEEEEPSYDMRTIYGPDGQTKRISIPKGNDYTPSEGWSLTKPKRDKNAPSPEQALRRTSQIKKAIATFNKTNEVTQAIVAANPNLRGMLGREVDESLKQDLMDAWRNEIDNLEQYIPEEYQESREEYQGSRERTNIDNDDPLGLFK